MGLLSFLKRIIHTGKNGAPNRQTSQELPEKYLSTLKFNQEFRQILSEDRFIARSDYRAFITEYQELADFYRVLTDSGMLKDFIKQHRLQEQEIRFFQETYKDIRDLKRDAVIIRKHNDSYVKRHLESEKDYLDGILKECDPNILLDDEQREVVLSEEDHTLVIAGAGAGKTTTVAAKVRYLVEKRGISPKQILVISFTNKAVGELKERINGNLKIDCPISTFHSVGYAILRKGDNEGQKVVEGSFMYYIINEYLKSHVLQNTSLVQKLILFFGSYFSAPYEGDNINEYFQFVSKADFSTLRSNLHEYAQQIIDRRSLKVQTLNNETLRSAEEVRIANYLYLNGIEYEYEPMYQYRILDANKPYTPDFRIKQGDKTAYIEHFGITENGQNNRYTSEELERYKARVNDKIRLHRKHRTDLIYTFSAYNDRRDFLEHLEEQLLQHGFELRPRPVETVYRKLVDSEESKYITKLCVLLCNFIGNFKTQGYKAEKFDEFKTTVHNVRTKLFLDICHVCYLEYQKALRERHYIDFQDMINESAELIHKKQIQKEKLDFKYIIVDEYQDISRQRYNLIRELSHLCDAKIIGVGDDWQSIYAFSGSVLPLFTRFCEELGYGQELKITKTYRNAQEVIDIAGTFIQKNTAQIRKKLISPKKITNPVIIRTYDDSFCPAEKGNRYLQLGLAVNQTIEEILKYNALEKKSHTASILLIGRYGFDAKHLCLSKEFIYDERTGKIYSAQFGSKIKLQFLTAHSSKGLSADNVIIINAKDGVYGFPSKVDDDPVLNLVVSNDQSYNYAEERRLFYVALTRTKNRVFLVTPEKRPSAFIRELLNDTESYPNVTLKGMLKADPAAPLTAENRCPICGYPLQIKWNKNYGLKLWICTNDQEICGYMTNDRKGGDLSIQKCDWCEDGYLIVKPGKQEYFLGCTNYRSDRTGCGRMLNRDHYLMWRKDEFGLEDHSVDKPSYFKPETAEKEEMPASPEMLPAKKKEKPAQERENRMNLVTYSVQEINTEKYPIATNQEGTPLTDMELLARLRALRQRIAEEKNIPTYWIFQNNVLVQLATDRPTTREEFMEVKGVGEKRYQLYGNDFIAEIRKYMEE